MKTSLTSSLATLGAAALLSAATGCGSSDLDSSSAGAGADTAATTSDTSCRIVTRSAAESTAGSPWELSTDSNGTTWLVWRGEVDVDLADATAAGTTVGVTWTDSISSDGWQTATASPVNGGDPGFQRFEFALNRDTYPDGDDGFGYSQLDIQFIPFLQLADGTKLYDHNRTSGNYNMNQQFHYAVTDDSSVCQTAGGPASSSSSNSGN